MPQRIGRRAEGHQPVAGVGEVHQAKGGDLFQQLVGPILERQPQPLRLVAVFNELLFQPVDDEPAAALDERHGGRGEHDLHGVGRVPPCLMGLVARRSAASA